MKQYFDRYISLLREQVWARWFSGVAVFVVIVAIGSALQGPQPEPASSQPEPVAKPDAKPEPKIPYKDAVKDCLGGVFYEVKPAGNATRVESPMGKMKANVLFFKSKREASDYYADLYVDAGAGGRAVAIWLKDAKDRDRSVITDCLTP